MILFPPLASRSSKSYPAPMAFELENKTHQCLETGSSVIARNVTSYKPWKTFIYKVYTMLMLSKLNPSNTSYHTSSGVGQPEHPYIWYSRTGGWGGRASNILVMELGHLTSNTDPMNDMKLIGRCLITNKAQGTVKKEAYYWYSTLIFLTLKWT